MVVQMMWLLIGCGEITSEPTAIERSVATSDYTGLHDGATWTFRNQGWNYDDPDTLLDSTIILAQHTGDGRMDFRRGLSWVDANPYGSLQFDISDGGMTLTEWGLPHSSGSGSYPFSGEEILVGETVTGDWSCTSSEPEDGAETYYAQYESAYVFNCEGGGLEGEWIFVYGLGLVQYLNPDASQGLELVAPW
jgi:hypothetical protein